MSSDFWKEFKRLVKRAEKASGGNSATEYKIAYMLMLNYAESHAPTKSEIAARADARIAELEAALLAERERICAAIRATDDAASACDYMLDSDDCIAVARGQLGPATYEDAARAGNGSEG